MYLHISKAYSAAAAECCQIGMRMAEFATPEIYNDFWSAFNPNPVRGNWILIGATYNNGDNTDSWCSNFAVIPNNIITDKFQAYENCLTEFITQRLIVDELKNSYFATPEDSGGCNMFTCSPL
jgi:hypothetical protein